MHRGSLNCIQWSRVVTRKAACRHIYMYMCGWRDTGPYVSNSCLMMMNDCLGRIKGTGCEQPFSIAKPEAAAAPFVQQFSYTIVLGKWWRISGKNRWTLLRRAGKGVNEQTNRWTRWRMMKVGSVSVLLSFLYELFFVHSGRIVHIKLIGDAGGGNKAISSRCFTVWLL